MRTYASLRDVPLGQRSLFNACFVLQHWFPQNERLRRRKEDVRARIIAHLQRGGPGQLVPVARERDLSPKDFRRRYLSRGLPVILEGAGRDWTCTREWSFDNFRRRFGHETIKLVQRKGVAPDDEVPDDREFSEEVLFSEFLDQALNGGRKYMRFSPLLEKFPELRNDFDQSFLRSMPDNNWGTTYQLFIGAKGTFTPLHNNIMPFFFLNICGVKRWQFIPSNYMAVLNPNPDGFTYNHSGADPENGNSDRYPGFESVDRMEAVMQPGDILYMPSWMWHSVRNEAATIGVRCGFLYPKGMLRESFTQTFIRAFAGNPSMLKTAWYSFIKTDLPNRDKLLVTPKVFTK